MQGFNLVKNVHDNHQLGMRIRSHDKIREQLTELSRLNPLASSWAFVYDWIFIASAIAFGEAVPTIWAYFLCITVIAGRQHALLVLMHEGAHFRLHKNATVNDFMSDFFAAFPLLADTAGYRVHHQAHHRHLNSDNDPDWTRKIKQPAWQFPKPKAVLYRDLLINFARCPLEWANLAFYFSFRSRWKLKLMYMAGISALLTAVDGWGVYLMYWLVPLFFIFPWIQRIRSMAEHFGLGREHELAASRNVLAPWYEAFFFGPHNVSYHLTHHLFPAVPFYRLARLSRLLNEIEEFAEKAHQNRSYLIPGKNSVLDDLSNAQPK